LYAPHKPTVLKSTPVGAASLVVDTPSSRRHDDQMETGGDSAAAVLAEVATALSGPRQLQLNGEIWQLLIGNIPEVRGDAIVKKVLRASVEENLATVLHIFEHGLTPEDVRAPTAAIEYARRLAQRGVPTIALVRSYRLGHGRFLTRCVEQLAQQTNDAELIALATTRMVEITFGYIDRVSEQAIEAYQHERDRWLLTQTAVRAGRVRDLLGGNSVDIDATEAALGYRLRQLHLGVIAWIVGSVHDTDGLAQLDRLGVNVARTLNRRGRYLFVPRDESLAWMWVPVGGKQPISHELLSTAFSTADETVRVVVGEPAYGLEGFRQTHLQAERTQDLALAARPGSQLTTFGDVGAIALICADMDAARNWVWRTLADLAFDDEPHARLRTTLQVFLQAGTYTATADRLTLHKNTVQYRIRKAEEALEGRVEDRADLELALRACQYLGQAVLRPVENA
jgi:DNA-binding PucR family transcriptional regulator